MESSSAIVAGILSVIFLYYFLFSKAQKPKNEKSPPEAGGALPIIGHIQLMAGGSSTQPAHLTLTSMAEKYGSIFTVRLGVHRALIVSDWKLAKEIFTSHDVAVSSRQHQMRAGKHLGYNDVMFSFTPYGPYWTAIRKVIAFGMLSARRVELQKDLCLSETRQSINELYRMWAQKRDPQSGRVFVEMKQWFGDLSLNVIFLMVVGKRFFGHGGAEEDSKRCREVLHDFGKLAGSAVPADALPWVGWLDVGGHEKKMKETGKAMNELVSKWLNEHRQNPDTYEKRQDFMDVIISALQEDATNIQYDPDTVIKSTCVNLIAGGTDTITVMLVWTISLLLNNRRALQKVQEELDIKVGKDRRVNESDIDNLVYLHAIIKETLRLYPAALLGGPREFTKDCTIGGYHVPRGTWLMINLWKMHRDPTVWPDPSEFRPERFITSHKNVNVKGQNFELLPFGAGRRICPGLNFAMESMLLVLASFLQGFDICTPNEELVDMTVTAGVSNGKATPLDVLLLPRLSSPMYN